MKLLVEVLRGKKIRSVAWLTPAPFCVVSYGGEVFKTKVAKEVPDELIWNENFTADFSSSVPELTVEIWQRGFGVGDSLIAKGSVRLSELRDSRWDRRWCETFYRHRGEELSAGLIEVQLQLFETQALLDEYRESARLNDASDVAAINVDEQGLRRRHWIPDTKSNECFWPACRVVFGPFNRRHHCRMCGLIFCSSHAASKRRIDRTALPCHDGAFLVRVCDGCAQIGASASASEEIDRLRAEFVKVHFASLSHAPVDGRPPMSPVPTADAAPLVPPRFMPVPPSAPPPPPFPVQALGLTHYPPHQNAHNTHAATAIAGGNTFFGGTAPHAHAPAEAWRDCWDAPSGRAYFWNTVSGEVSWSRPSGGDGALVGPTATVLGDRRPSADLYPMQPPATADAAASLWVAEEVARASSSFPGRQPSLGTQASLQLAQMLQDELLQAEDAERANAEAAALLLAQDIADEEVGATRCPSAGTVASLRLAQELMDEEADARLQLLAGTVASLRLAQELRQADEDAIEAARHSD